MKKHLTNRKAILFLVLFQLLITSSCSRVPQATSYSFSTQHKMQSVDHWNILARDTAEQLNKSLSTKLPTEFACVYIEPSDSTFGAAFTNLLNSNLLQILGERTDPETKANTALSQVSYTIADKPDINCSTVNFTTQIIKHRADRQGRLYPGTFTFLTSAVAVMRNFQWYEMLVGAGVVADLMGGTMNTIPHNEVLITTKIASENRILSMQTDMYYINDRDTWHYEKEQPLTVKAFEVVGGTDSEQ